MSLVGQLDFRRLFIGNFGGGTSHTTDGVVIEYPVEAIAIGGGSVLDSCLVLPKGSDRSMVVSAKSPLIGHLEGGFTLNPTLVGMSEALELYFYLTAPPPFLGTSRSPLRRVWIGGVEKGTDNSTAQLGQICTQGRKSWRIGIHNGNAASMTVSYTVYMASTSGGAVYTSSHTDVITSGSDLVTDSDKTGIGCHGETLQLTADVGFLDGTTRLIMETED